MDWKGFCEQWDFYPTDGEGDVRFIAWNVGLHQAAPMRGKPWLLTISIALQGPSAGGEPDEEEGHILRAIHHRLWTEVSDATKGMYAFRTTTATHQHHCFYAPERVGLPGVSKDTLDLLRRAVARVMLDIDRGVHDWDVTISPDPEWEAYRALFPSPEPSRWFRDRARVKELQAFARELGEPLDGAHRVVHFVEGLTAEEGERACALAEAQGFRFHLADDGVAEFKRPLHLYLNEIHGTALDVSAIAEAIGHEYGWWQAAIQGAPDPTIDPDRHRRSALLRKRIKAITDTFRRKHPPKTDPNTVQSAILQAP